MVGNGVSRRPSAAHRGTPRSVYLRRRAVVGTIPLALVGLIEGSHKVRGVFYVPTGQSLAGRTVYF